jgi:hypothetical protein
MIHLICHRLHHDGQHAEAWCGVDVTEGGFHSPAFVTCEQCLADAAEWGAQVAARLVAIRQAAIIAKATRRRRCDHPLADETCDGVRHNHPTDLDWKPGQPWDD